LPRFDMLTPFRCDGHAKTPDQKNHRMPQTKTIL
jgi:hypothetical protein